MGFEEHVHDGVFGRNKGVLEKQERVGMAFCFFFRIEGGRTRLLAGTCSGGEGTEGVVTIGWKDVELQTDNSVATYFNLNSGISEASSAAWVRGCHDHQGHGHARKRMVTAPE
jgi:hypothetical protein